MHSNELLLSQNKHYNFLHITHLSLPLIHTQSKNYYFIHKCLQNLNNTVIYSVNNATYIGNQY